MNILVFKKNNLMIFMVFNEIIEILVVNLFSLLIKFIVFVIVSIYSKVIGKFSYWKWISFSNGNVKVVIWILLIK